MANETVVCTYRVRPDAEERFAGLLRTHWRTLHGLGFVTGEPPLVLRGTDGGLTYVEIFTWVEGGFGVAHEHPDVLMIWEAMDPLLEDRDGRPKWEFPHFVRVAVEAGPAGQGASPTCSPSTPCSAPSRTSRGARSCSCCLPVAAR